MPVLLSPTLRQIFRPFAFFAWLCLLALVFPLPATAGLKSVVPSSNASTFITADEAFQLVSSESENGLFLDFRVTPGYYLYRDRFRFDIVSGAPDIATPIFSSEGDWEDDPTFGRVKVFHENVTIRLPVKGSGQIKVVWQGCANAGLCYPPQDKIVNVAVDAGFDIKPDIKPDVKLGAESDVKPDVRLGVGADTATTTPIDSTVTPSTTTSPPTTETLGDNASSYQLLLIFVLGLGLALTPCVLPMLPILAGVIARQHTSSALRGLLLAFAYVVGVATVYALIGFMVGLLGQQINLPGLFQRAPVIIAFALVFLILAFSLFGLFELRLPSSLSNYFDRLSRRQQGGALLGSYLIGVFSALVVSPCVSAPLVGVLLHVSTTGSALYGAAALFLMALGMGMPLLLLGVTEGRLLPKAGTWTNEVKTFFGLMLLFVAAELLTRLVPAPLALGLYGLCTAGTGFWLWQLHTGSRKHLDLLTRTLSFSVLAYAFALIVGAASGGDDPLKPLAQISSQSQSSTATPFIQIKNSANLDREIATAKREGKVLMFDFYADWCVSCKVMERHVFRKPEIAERLSRLHLVQIDITANNADHKTLLKRFSVLGPPSILFFDSNGQEIIEARVVGEKNARDFLQHLDRFDF